ncbi:MAG: DUF3108 domain-containing protein [Pseudomonadota bacterium]
MIVRALLAMAFAALAVVPDAGNASPPASIAASYDVYQNGLPVAVVQEAFEKNGAKYRIVSDSTPTGLLALFVRTRIKIHSSGAVTPAGLRPEQFDYGRLDDASKNVSAAFDWQAGQLHLTFDGRNETITLPQDTQDRVSLMYQFMFLPAEKLGDLAFHMTNGKKVEPYRYRLAGTEMIDTPLGKLSTLRLVKQREPGDNAVEVWLASDRNYFPVRLLILENDGSKFEQVITRLEFK